MSSSVLTNSSGNPIDDKTNSMTVGPRGPILLQDHVLIDELAHFDRERIPERVVHAKGAGAFGYFEVTHDITKYTKAALFSQIGKKTKIAFRGSTVAGEAGSADTVRDTRGFALKFYTEEGNWDMVGNNTPVFFIRDPLFFPSLVHSHKRNPVTHLKDATMFWDFASLRSETTHQMTVLFSDRGIPDGFRHLHGFGSHTYKFVNAEGVAVYVKYHFKTNQGIKNLSADEAARIAANDPDYSIRDLYDAIAKGDYPSWNFFIQVMTFEQAEKFRWNPFDMTKTWPHADFPLIPVGRIVLDTNPKNYFAEVEQIAFSPAHLVPGIEPSPDKILQGRLFAYSDTHRYRLGVNYQQLPVNCPFAKVNNYQRDGSAAFNNQDGAPNYFPNSFHGPHDDKKYAWSSVTLSADVARYNSADDDNFTQAGILWRNVLKPEERERLANNIAIALVGVQDSIQKRAIANFAAADSEFGKKIEEYLKKA